MATYIKMLCGDCGLAMSVGPIKKEFVSFNGGRSYGFGRWHQPDIDKLIEPTGWVWSDPYTSCTYCPDCWNKIESGDAA